MIGLHGGIDAHDAGLEVNTDPALVDPDWEDFAEEHDRRFGLAISWLKGEVRGESWDNDVMKLRVGEGGFYAQSKRFPAAFYGDTSRPERRLVDADEARALAWEAVAAYRAGEARSLTALWSSSDPGDVFFGYRLGGASRYELGVVRAGAPLHLRAMVDADEEHPLVGARRGAFLYQALPDGRHLVVVARGPRRPFLFTGALEGIG